MTGTGRVVSGGSGTSSHLANGQLWVDTLINPANPLGGGTYPMTTVKRDGWSSSYDGVQFVNVNVGADGSLQLQSTVSKVSLQHATTSGSANTVIDGFGIIYRSTSSRRYKQDVEDATVDPAAVLKMQGRTWRDRSQVEQDPDTEDRYVGFIAEELDELGLAEFVLYNEDGQPDAIAYDRLTVALLAVLKDQERRLRRVEGIVR